MQREKCHHFMLDWGRRKKSLQYHLHIIAEMKALIDWEFNDSVRLVILTLIVRWKKISPAFVIKTFGLKQTPTSKRNALICNNFDEFQRRNIRCTFVGGKTVRKFTTRNKTPPASNNTLYSVGTLLELLENMF